MAADSEGLTQQEKTEKRLQFNRFFEEELAREKRKAREKSGGVSPAAEKNWSISLTPSYGYDSNVNLGSPRKGDTYTEEIIEGRIRLNHPGILFFGPGNWGMGGSSDFFNYTHMVSTNFNQTVFNGFVDSKITPEATFKLSYDLGSVNYDHDNQLSYSSHKFKPSIAYAWNKQWVETFYNTIEIKDYSKRRALMADDFPSEKERRDVLYEAGTGFRFIPEKTKIFSVTAGYKKNNSNDSFNDFNDYQDLKVLGYAFFQLSQNFSAVAYGGYDYKRYDGRSFLSTADRRETDSFFYSGGTLYYDFWKFGQLFASYLYKQNYSNDPSQNYSGYTISSGITFTV